MVNRPRLQRTCQTPLELELGPLLEQADARFARFHVTEPRGKDAKPVPRALTTADRNRVFATLEQWCSSGSVVALRTRALVALAADSGLRVNECCALEVDQLLAFKPKTSETVKLARSFYLRPAQAKGGGAGTVELSPRARAAIGAYVRAAVAAGWMSWPPKARAPLFLGHRGRGGARGHARLSKRSAQHSWHDLQARARLSSRYPFHTLRHDAASRWRRSGADLFALMRQMRWRDVQTAQRYVHELDAGERAPRIASRVG